MCLITNLPKQIAEHDIIVHKCVNENLTPCTQGGNPYELCVLYETEMQQSNDICVADNRAVKYVEKSLLLNLDGLRRELPKGISCIGEGFHSCTSIERATELRIRNEIIVKGYIPKGSEYYTDGDGLIVSNKLVLIKIL